MTTKTRIFTIDGNIGSGKSTLLNHLKEHYKNNENIIFADEPVSEWQTICDSNGMSMLEKFYTDQKTYSFPFQMMAYISRLDILRKIVKANPNAIIISERSLHTDRLVFAKMLFDSGLIEDVNYQIYLKWFDTFIEDYPITGVIYVKTNPQICFDRIKQRSRTGESDIPLDYLTKCDTYHESMMKEVSVLSNKILTLNGNQDIFNEPGSLSNWLHDIDSYIQQI
jgi:deoxyadenosine/deoxycytidine kinase